jgi:hypothetical protein
MTASSSSPPLEVSLGEVATVEASPARASCHRSSREEASTIDIALSTPAATIAPESV